jgi:sugar lactone lactonase YvrE
VWKINVANPSLIPVGFIPTSLAPSCGFTGIAFNDVGDLFVADGGAGRIYIFTPSAGSPPNATVFAAGIPGTNAVAFDRDGNLWTGDGTTGQGRVWKITGAGANCTPPSPVVNCQEIFRIQPMANEVNLIDGVGGVGRDVRALPPGAIAVTATSRNAANILGSQPLVANGIAFNQAGDMFVIDTARGALWKVQFDRQGNLQSPVGCDSTFAPDTLCLSNVFVAHPILEGGDGIALDRAGNIWVDANERNAVAVVTKDGRVTEVFRNPVNSSGLRNSADPSVGNNHILEFPTSPFLSGKIFCTANSDGDRRDNSPRSAGEVDGGGTGQRGKISCMDQELIIPGLQLPVR